MDCCCTCWHVPKKRDVLVVGGPYQLLYRSHAAAVQAVYSYSSILPRVYVYTMNIGGMLQVIRCGVEHYRALPLRIGTAGVSLKLRSLKS